MQDPGSSLSILSHWCTEKVQAHASFLFFVWRQDHLERLGAALREEKRFFKLKIIDAKALRLESCHCGSQGQFDIG